MSLSTKKKFGILLGLALGGVLLMFAFSRMSSNALTKFVASSDTEYEHFEKKGNLAILEIHGVIMDSKEALKSIHELKERSEIKAVVVRINSPGGAVAPSQEIFEALKELSKEKPIVCSLGDLAASGGYYIAVACPKIVANPGTLTGSIGVIMQFANLKDLYAWAKVEPYVMKAGKHKDMGSSLRAMTEEERQILQEMLDGVHHQFKEAVEKGRGFKPGYVDLYADGRIFTGEKARDLGFVDELGGEDHAVNIAAELGHIKGKPKIVRESTKRDRFSRFFDSDSEYGGPRPGAASENGLERSLGRLVDHLAPQFLLRPGMAYLLPAHMFTEGALR